ncbi:MAG: tRNA (adenosine(37)-N6)-threonylcarbamoyltransferase complex ATPase subunit type 1 TsaE [Planctomycetota bacterium]|nr:tRNA (adenosine(37)-N6)-threonylcarbamoyltransferase complex ATPase subunit type 1 TsaE [Planctomycetota bacterium]
MDVESTDTDGTLRWGALLAEALRASALTEFVIDLRGELGAGKTVFVRGLGRALGVAATVPMPSPTFTIARAYALPGPLLRELHHLDAYRLGGPDELEAAGFEEMCGEGRITCVEWGGRVEAGLPEDRLLIECHHERPLARAGAGQHPEPGVWAGDETPAGRRRLAFSARGPGARVVLQLLASLSNRASEA